MRTLLLTVCYLTYTTAKSLSERIDARNVAEDFDGELSTFKGGEYFYMKAIRQPRLSDTRTAKPVAETKITKTSKLKIPLVKKPIPKFTDGGSDEDYLVKLKFPNRVSDSIELEDEDFSVDDYDFDVDHDEFAGRGKPLQPRVKAIRQRPKPTKIKKARPTPEVIRPVENVVPHDKGKPSVKVARKAGADKMKEEEYDEEFTAGTKSMEKYKKSTSKDDTSSDENEESKEEKKRPSRAARSSPLGFGAYEDKLRDKNGEIPKMLSYLPLFSLSHATLDRVQQDLSPKTFPGFIHGLVSQFN